MSRSEKRLKRFLGEATQSALSVTNPQSPQSSAAVGAVVAILIIGAVAVLGYYQFAIPHTTGTTATTTTGPTVTCPGPQCANVTIPTGASSFPPGGYTAGETTTWGYAPDSVTVVMGVNNTVYWLNNDTTGAPHTVTSDTGVFDSTEGGPLATYLGTFQYTFTTPGTYHYHCSYHPWMQGTVIVLPAGSAASSSATSTATPTQTSTTST